MADTGTFTLRLLGPFGATLNGAPLAQALHNDRLLALLVLRSAVPSERAWLAATLWPDAGETNARFYLRRTLAALRQALGTQAERLLSPTSRTLQLDLTGADCDLLAFDMAVQRGDRASLEEATALYRGPLLEGWYEEWALLDRETRAQRYLDAREALARDALARQAPEEAVRHLRALLAVEPLRESAQRVLMRALAALGDYAAVTQTYRDFRLLLHQELRTDPAAETSALYRSLRTQAQEKAQPLPQSLVASAPPLRRLPPARTTFIGREAEKAQLVLLLQTTRLLTLSGSGGVGKTRLAVAVAEEVADEYPGGVCFVDLAPLQGPDLIVQAVASALEVREEPSRPLLETLLDTLQPRLMLLILDNCEHLAEGCASLAETLLSRCPHLRLLVTSRQPLGAAGEQMWRVPSLTLPEGKESELFSEKGAQALWMEAEAVRLFVDRASSVSASFQLTRESLRSVVAICRLLEGIPLAIELAAAWVRVLPVAQTLTRLRDRLDLLQNRQSGRLLRHQTLRATLDWSYGLLEEKEQRLLSRLSVFVGGWSLEAAEAVCGEEGEAPDGVLLGLAGLVDKSLVVYEEQKGVGRYRLLETTRQYAREKLRESGEEERWLLRHRDCFLDLAEEAHTKRFHAEGPALMQTLEQEHDNCRAALDFCAAGSDVETHLRLAGALNQFWALRGYFREGRAHLDNALSRPYTQERTAARARALNGAANLARIQSDHDAARRKYQQSGEIWRALGEMGPLAIVLNNMGITEVEQNHYDLAQPFYEQSLTLMRALDDRAGMALVLSNFGWLTFLLNDLVRARILLEESIALSRETGNLIVLELALGNLANVLIKQGDYATARAQYREALILQATSRNEPSLVISFEAMSELAACLGQPHQGVQIFAAATAMRERLGSPVYLCSRAEYDRRRQLLRDTLDEEVFAQEWEVGFALTTEEALALAQEIL